MKFLLLVSLLGLSSLSMGVTPEKTAFHHRTNDMISSDAMANDILNKGVLTYYPYVNMTGPDMMKKYLEHFKESPEIKKEILQFEDIKLKLMKEMESKNPDFKKVQDINRKLANIQADIKTKIMQKNYNLTKKKSK